jgi:peptide/nickel transport system ATP-binding protein
MSNTNRKVLFEARDLTCTFQKGKKVFTAVDHLNFDIHQGEIISIVGESGSGKTTLAKMLLNLQEVSSGDLTFEGEKITNPRAHWRKVQAVFQDPFASFNQFFSVTQQLKDSFNLFNEKPSDDEMLKQIEDALKAVNLEPSKIEGKYPFELSGGQMQRLLIARAFLINPKVLIADEPTSMVDACSRANILDFLLELKERLDMTIIFITHDIGLAYYVSDRVFIMKQGQIVEQGAPKQVILKPEHPYTKNLLADIPQLHKEWVTRKLPKSVD